MPENRFRVTGRVVFGLVVIGLGVLFTLDNLGLVHSGDVLRWWPALVVAYGVARLTGFCCRQHLTVGLIFTVGGGWLLLHDLGLVRRDPWELWPLILVVIGGSLVVGALRRQRGPDGSEEASSRLNAFALWSGAGRKVVTQDFRGGDVTAIMGGHDLDLRSAGMAGDTAVIDLFVWWGGVDLRVPDNWVVTCEALPVMGGVDDLTKAPAGEVRGHLILRGLIVMGGVEVKN